MSRLFEALSGLKTEHRTLETLAPNVEAPSAVVPSLPGQEAEPEHHSLKVVLPAVGPLALVHVKPVREVEEGNEALPKPAKPVVKPATKAPTTTMARVGKSVAAPARIACSTGNSARIRLSAS